MDMVFSAPVHQDPLLMIEIIDKQWAAETLPVEDIVVAPAEMTNLEEDEPPVPPEEDEADKWNDLSLDGAPLYGLAREPDTAPLSSHSPLPALR